MPVIAIEGSAIFAGLSDGRSGHTIRRVYFGLVSTVGHNSQCEYVP